ncbi:hypothetical protein [Streptomyces sp. SAJ15]|uniref:hypothetical protein n=1 Tax=Streptomyces sp. SAJ15 TaxID=2011095 RepID=UPI001185F5D8|nr:hypothetical protein [Streptomyces sp. SAJ15]TVL89461.1 hypothetical protein CD790_26590 [Streptomyces sp. SAJ15]
MGRPTRLAAACAAAALLTMGVPATGANAAEPTPRIDLRVLVVTDGGPATQAIMAELEGSGTPYTTVDLTAAGRPKIDEAFLSDSVDGRPRARYQAVVLPDDNPFGDASAEMAALASYEKRFGIRQVDAYTYARPAVGLNLAQNPGYAGSLDGRIAQVTAAGAAGPFGYLDGRIPFEDASPSVSESYGYLAVPLERQAPGAGYTSYVDAPIDGTSARGSLIGEYTHDGRSELVVTFVYNQHQSQYRLLARGIVEWATQGVHLGADRNYLAVHVDDVLGADDRWDTELNCTPGDIDCGSAGSGVENDPIRMTAADADHAKQWSQSHDLPLDLAYNAGGSESYKEEHGGTDPLAQRLITDQSAFRWINHTYNHPFLGCVQDTGVVPWRCAEDPLGGTRWVGQGEITSQIDDNLAWAGRNNVAVDRDELVTGEHSGLKTLPQQPEDNPNLSPALTLTGVTSLASDNSREREQRTLGPARTVPRFPMNVFYNAGRTAEQVDEYNWIYTRKADGGSGLCETTANTTCLPEPLDTTTGYASYIVPLESRIALGHVIANDPRPHFIHQSNLAEDRIAYPVLEKVLADYAGLHADNTPLVNLRMKDIGSELRRRAAWRAAVDAGRVSGYRIGDTVTVTTDGSHVPATLPPGTELAQTQGGVPFGSPYAGRRSGWAAPAGLQNEVVLTLPGGATPAAESAPVTAARVQEPAPEPVLPAGVREPVSYGPGDTVAESARQPRS